MAHVGREVDREGVLAKRREKRKTSNLENSTENG